MPLYLSFVVGLVSALQQICLHESGGGPCGYPADPGGAKLRPGDLHAVLVQAEGPGVTRTTVLS